MDLLDERRQRGRIDDQARERDGEEQERKTARRAEKATIPA